MTTVDDVVRFLEAFAPRATAADWDNVGLLLGDRRRPVGRVLTCLTVSPAVVDEALDERVDLLVAHHPLPFKPLRTITTDDYAGGLVWRLASAGVSLYSPHTAFDSAADGINQRLAAGLGLVDVAPLEPIAASADPTVGVGRRGHLPQPQRLADFVARVKKLLHVGELDVVGDDERTIGSVAVACGSAGDLLSAALRARADVFVTGEARFHSAVEAEARGIALVLAGHYATERFGIEHLAVVVHREFPDLVVRPAHRERDPLRRV